MNIRYCVDCELLEKRLCMRETSFDSGVYVPSGHYYRCKKYGNRGGVFHSSDELIEYQLCPFGELSKK